MELSPQILACDEKATATTTTSSSSSSRSSSSSTSFIVVFVNYARMREEVAKTSANAQFKTESGDIPGICPVFCTLCVLSRLSECWLCVRQILNDCCLPGPTCSKAT